MSNVFNHKNFHSINMNIYKCVCIYTYANSQTALVSTKKVLMEIRLPGLDNLSFICLTN